MATCQITDCPFDATRSGWCEGHAVADEFERRQLELAAEGRPPLRPWTMMQIHDDLVRRALDSVRVSNEERYEVRRLVGKQAVGLQSGITSWANGLKPPVEQFEPDRSQPEFTVKPTVNILCGHCDKGHREPVGVVLPTERGPLLLGVPSFHVAVLLAFPFEDPQDILMVDWRVACNVAVQTWPGGLWCKKHEQLQVPQRSVLLAAGSKVELAHRWGNRDEDHPDFVGKLMRGKFPEPPAEPKPSTVRELVPAWW